MRGNILIGVTIFITIVIVILSNTNAKMVDKNHTTPKELLNNTKIYAAIAEPEKYKDYPVDISGKISNANGRELAIIVVGSKKEREYVRVLYSDRIDFKEDDFIRVKGKIKGSSNLVMANLIEKIDATEALAPTKHLVEVNKTDDNKFGYVIVLKKIEFAETETRVFVTVKNNSEGTISFYKYESKALQGEKQYDSSYGEYRRDYPKVQSDMLPGVVSEGILVFPPLDYKAKKAKFVLKGASPARFGMVYERAADFEVTWD